MSMHGLYTSPPPRAQAPVIPQDVPCYRVTEEKGFYVDDRLIPVGTIVAWEEEPSKNMEPMNALAVEGYKKYLAKLDKYGQEKALADKKHYNPLLTQFENKLKSEEDFEDTRRAKVLNSPGDKQIPVMGAKLGRPKATELTADVAPVAKPVDKLRLK